MRTTPQLKIGGSREGNGAEPVHIWKARNFIHEHSDEEISLIQVAKTVNISGNYLSEKFKQVTGVNFGRLHCPHPIRKRRVVFCTIRIVV